jgi:hypothetical protein
MEVKGRQFKCTIRGVNNPQDPDNIKYRNQVRDEYRVLDPVTGKYSATKVYPLMGCAGECKCKQGKWSAWSAWGDQEKDLGRLVPAGGGQPRRVKVTYQSSVRWRIGPCEH